ncbi:MAG: S41 family peptidase [Planctomycetota bacterium]
MMFRTLARLTFRLLAVLLALAAAAAAWDVCTYDAEAWRRDYEHLKSELAKGYANLDWIAENRRLDLPALDRDTEAAILGAHSRVFAFLALRRFIRAFGDPHLRFVPGDRAAFAATPLASDGNRPLEPTLTSLDGAGYERDDYAFRVPFHRLPGWTPLTQAPFAAGMVQDLGVLRIASFGEDRYLETAERAFVSGMTKRDLQLAVRALLQQQLRETLRQLSVRGVRRLLVDVTGNGGGTEWVTEVVALFTDRELTRRATRLLASGVDRRGVWSGQPVPSVLLPEDQPQRLRGTGEWTGPLFVLVDQNTGSAAEDFVVWLDENEVATVLGSRTAGAGGGYVDGGGRIRLTTCPFDVKAPNCARFLADGSNEIAGIAPDTVLPMTTASEDELMRALVAALAR